MMRWGYLLVREGMNYWGGEDTVTYGSHHSASDDEEVLGNTFLPHVPVFGGCEEDADCSEHQGEGQMECFVILS